MQSVRVNYDKCAEQCFSLFIKNISKNTNFVFRAHNPAGNGVMQDRYTYSRKNHRVSIVYETKAQKLVITAPPGVINEVSALLPAEIAPKDQAKNGEQRVFVRDAVEPKQAQNHDGQKQLARQSEQKGKKQAKAQKASSKPKQEQKNEQKANSKPKQEQKNEQKPAKQAAKKSEQKGANKQVQAASGGDQKAHPNTFTIKKVSEERFNELLKKIKANKNMRYKQSTAQDGIRAYTVSSNSEKAIVKYAMGDAQLMGSRGDLYSELQLMMSQASDYKTAIKSHIKFSGEEKRAQDIEKQLKKQLPNAFEFLSEQSKIDLAIGIIDINNSAVVLSDYSTLLIPCFRGLERLIFDLQHAQGIVVKMIGQAYEKEDGNYVLKYGYRRRIPSVIYAEVMAALYTEYFKHRNFYAHSDGGFDNVSRVISDKEQVKTIFNRIMQVINYNGKKLKEIGFTIK